MSKDEAFVTLATNDVYAKGALVLAESLKRHGTTKDLIVMTTPQISNSVMSALECVFDVVKRVNVLDSKDEARLTLMKRPELGVTFTKLHCWTLTEYRKCVFMDADMLVLQNIDELFEREELSASRDSGWPDIFNSGLFVFKPSLETFNKILGLADDEGSFDGGDQGLLNSYFSDWSTDLSRHLPFLYNLHITASYTYMPAFKKFGQETKVVHFLGAVKPWHYAYDKSASTVKQTDGPGDQEWWSIYQDKCQRYFLSESESVSENSSACVISRDILANDGLQIEDRATTSPKEALQEKWEHKNRWESGNVDYQGEDKFENIQEMLDTYL